MQTVSVCRFWAPCGDAVTVTQGGVKIFSMVRFLIPHKGRQLQSNKKQEQNDVLKVIRFAPNWEVTLRRMLFCAFSLALQL